MAVRIPKFLRQLYDALGLTSQPGSLLRWGSTKVENATPFDVGIGDWGKLGIYVGQTQPELHPSYEAWVAAGRTGYWGFIESSGELTSGNTSISSLGGIVQLVGGIPTVTITTASVTNASIQASSAVLQLVGGIPAVENVRNASIQVPTSVLQFIGGIPTVSSMTIGSSNVFASAASVQFVAGSPAIVVTSPVVNASVVSVAGAITVVGGVPVIAQGTPVVSKNVTTTGGTLALVGGIATITVGAAGGTGSLIPANSNFTSDITATAYADQTWWKYTNGNGAGATTQAIATVSSVTSPAQLTGSAATSAYLHCVAGTVFDGFDTWPSEPPAECLMYYRFTKSQIDATSGVLTWDTMYTGDTTHKGSGWLAIVARDGTNTTIIDTTTGKNNLLLWSGGGTGMVGAQGDVSTIAVAGDGAKHTATFDLDAWVTARLTSGKTWSDVASVELQFHAIAVTGGGNTIGDTSYYITNFR